MLNRLIALCLGSLGLRLPNLPGSLPGGALGSSVKLRKNINSFRIPVLLEISKCHTLFHLGIDILRGTFADDFDRNLS